jgi:hypothetical protein
MRLCRSHEIIAVPNGDLISYCVLCFLVFVPILIVALFPINCDVFLLSLNQNCLCELNLAIQ